VGRDAWRRGQLGSLVLLLIASALILRPWESGEPGSNGPAVTRALVVRVVDGDTIAARIEDVSYIGTLSRVSRPTLRLPAVASG
jgi:hypothetical protein